MRFKSKIDAWLRVLIGFSLLLPVTILIVLYQDPLKQNEAWLGWFSLFCILGVYLGLVFPMVYTLEEDCLMIRAGILVSRIPYSQIEKVYPNRSPVASQALSIDRLCVQSRLKTCYISPQDKGAFIAFLHTKTPHLQLSPDGLSLL